MLGRDHISVKYSQPMLAPATCVHVLAIDDDVSVRQMIADYLTDNEIRVTALASGREIADVIDPFDATDVKTSNNVALIDEMDSLLTDWGVPSFKIFMNNRGGEGARLSEAELERIAELVAKAKKEGSR